MMRKISKTVLVLLCFGLDVVLVDLNPPLKVGL